MSIFITGLITGSILWLIGKTMESAYNRRHGIVSEPRDRSTVNGCWVVLLVLVAMLAFWASWPVWTQWLP
jgi:hypothetical protein